MLKLQQKKAKKELVVKEEANAVSSSKKSKRVAVLNDTLANCKIAKLL
jgi:hypothetical protein